MLLVSVTLVEVGKLDYVYSLSSKAKFNTKRTWDKSMHENVTNFPFPHFSFGSSLKQESNPSNFA